jgi:hypothetical protein
LIRRKRMAKYRNVSGYPLVIGNLKIAQNAIVELSESRAEDFGNKLQPVGTSTQQVLTEAPIGEAKPVIEESEEE